MFRLYDRVRVLECPANPDCNGKAGRVEQILAFDHIGVPSVIRVRLDGSTETEWQEVDGPVSLFLKLTEGRESA